VNPKPRQALFCLLLVMSGLCGISYEILYGRILGDLIGEQLLVSASILLTFLLGIGFGTLFAHRLWRHLWLLEAGIGAYGALLALSVNGIDHALYQLPALNHFGIAGPLAFCVVILIVPAFLIGTSVPIFSGYAAQLFSGKVFGRVYGLYNAGAALTVLLIEFWVIRSLGIRGATLAIALGNGFVAIALRTAFAGLRELAPSSSPPSAEETLAETSPWAARRPLIALALASIASAIFQLVMIKLSECIFGPYRETFALVLSMTLGSIALGSVIVGKLELELRQVLIVAVLGMLMLLVGFEPVAQFFAKHYEQAAEGNVTIVLLKVLTLGALMAVPAIAFGATVPALVSEQGNVAEESGRLLFISSMANAFGFLLVITVLHEQFDYSTLLTIIACLAGIGLLIDVGLSAFGAAGLLAMGLTIYAGHSVWDEQLLYVGHTAFHSTKRLKKARNRFQLSETFKRGQDIFSIVHSGGTPYFFINGYISIPLNSESEKVVGALGSSFSPRLDQALVLGVGSGATTSAVTQVFEKTTAIEINAVVLENLFRMKEYNFDLVNDKRATLIHDDAIHYVKAGSDRYSLIINTVTTPLYFSSSKLYTKDFLSSIKQRLKPDGVYCTWIDRRVGERGIDIMLKTLNSEFKECGISYLTSSYFLMLCSDQPLKACHALTIAKNPALSGALLRSHGTNPAWLPYQLLRTKTRDLIKDRKLPLNTLDFPALEFEMARLRERGYRKFQERLAKNLDLDDVASAFTKEQAFDPIALLRHAKIMLGGGRYVRAWRKQINARDPNFDKKYRASKQRHLELCIAAGADPKDANQLHKLGFRLMKLARYKEAVKAFKACLAVKPTRRNAHFNLGASYEYLDELNLALENYRRATALSPTDGDVPYRIGRVLFKQKHYKEALSELDRATKLGSDSRVDYYRGKTFQALGKLREAEAAYRLAIKKDPKDGAAHGRLMQIQVKLANQKASDR